MKTANYFCMLCFQATGAMEKLQKDETDVWGMTHKEGANIIHGNYFTKIDVFRNRRIQSNPAIVPAYAVIFAKGGFS